MILDHVAVARRDLMLETFDLLTDELNHFPAVHINHVVVMFATIEFIDSLTAFEIMLDDDACRLELGQHAIDRRQANILLVGEQFLVDILGGEVLNALLFENLQNAHPRVGHLEANSAQLFGFLFHNLPLRTRRFQAGSVSSDTFTIRDATRMQKLITLLVFAMLALSLAGCHFVYTPDVQQGNLLDKKTVDQLKPGMTKHQVLVLMGTPSVSTPFDQSRWDYVSTQSRRGGPIKLRTLTLTFNNDTLARSDGDFFAQDAKQLVKDAKKYNSGYPTNETKGDKDMSGSDKKSDGGLDPSGSGH